MRDVTTNAAGLNGTAPPVSKRLIQVRPSIPPEANHLNGAKSGFSVLRALEAPLIAWLVPRLPQRLKSTHLTFATLPICGVIVAACALSRADVRWLWLASAAIVLQWLTDSLDGALGRARNTGLVRWGYYVDHLLDFVFISAIFAGYLLIVPSAALLLFAAFALIGAIEVSTFLVVAAAKRFQIAHCGFGPTEGRLLLVGVNALAIFRGVGIIPRVLPWLIGLMAVALIGIAVKEARTLWRMDAVAREAARRKLS